MPDYIIKLADTQAEIDGRDYVHYKSWHEAYEGLVAPEYLGQLTLEKCVSIARKFPNNILVAKQGERVVGFVAYGKYRNDSLTECGEVYAIYVLQEFYGKKVGYALMNAAVERLSEYKRIAVWVLKGNERAIKFYEQYGFRFDGTEAEITLGMPCTELRMILERA